MAMPCPEKMDQLPIDDRYKQAIAAFCSDPQNESACQLLCDAPPEVIANKFSQVEDELATWVEQGPPQELAAVMQQEAPEMAQAAGEILATQGPAVLNNERLRRQQPQGFARGGLASLGRFGDTQTAHVTKGEMIIPNYVLNDTGLRTELNRVMERMGADPARYTVGGKKVSLNPQTGRPEFLSLGGIIGGIAGVALAPVTGGLSLAAAAGLGAAAGTFLDTGDPIEAAMMGLGAYGIAGLGVGAGLWGAGTTGYGAGLTAYWTAPGSTALGGMFAAAPEAVAAGAQAMQYTGPAFIGTTGETISTGALMTPEIAAAEGIGSSWLAPASTQQLMAGNVASFGGDIAGTSFLGGTGGETGAALSKAATTPVVTPNAPAAPGKGVSFFDKAANWWNDSSMLEKAGALSAGSALLGMTGALDAEPVPRPEGYNLQTDPSAQYGGKSYETLGPSDLFGNIDQMGSGVPGSPGNPIGGVGTPTVSPSGYSYGAGRVPSYSYGVGRVPSYSYGVGRVPSYAALNAATGGHVRGPGTATSDSIPAYLSDGEFVMTTKAVRGAGNGSLRDGAKRLYAMMDELERRG
jgi:hypothetical protein